MEKKEIGKVKLFIMLFFAGLSFFYLSIYYLVWRLFSFVVNLICVKIVRNTDGKLETPIVFYEHPVTKRMVAFIAMIHLAEPEYYSALNRRIKLLSGYKILFEGIGRLSKRENKFLTQEERDVFHDFDSRLKLLKKIGNIMLLKYQKDKGGLFYDLSWVNNDIRLYDFIKSSAKQNLCFVKEEKKLYASLDDESMQLFSKWLNNMMFSQFLPAIVVANIIGFFFKNERLINKLILDARNEEAMRGINKYLAKGNVALIWGAMHLVGIGKELKRAGFREVRREWFTAYHVRDYHLFESLKKEGIINTFKEAANSIMLLKKDLT